MAVDGSDSSSVQRWFMPAIEWERGAVKKFGTMVMSGVAVLVIAGLAGCGGSSDGTASSAESNSKPKRTTTTQELWTCDDGTQRSDASECPTTTTTTLPPVPVLTRANCTETPPDGVFEKDSASTKGRCLHFWANIFQFDSNTGKCQFLGKYASGPRQYSFEFSGATIRVDGSEGPLPVTVDGAPGTAPPNSCALLAPIVADDKVEVWGISDGTDSYDTVSGGSNSYTIIKLVDIRKVG